MLAWHSSSGCCERCHPPPAVPGRPRACLDQIIPGCRILRQPFTSPCVAWHASPDRYPEYLHDPESLKAEARAKQRQEDAKHGAWRPNQGSKSDCVRSIVRMNLK